MRLDDEVWTPTAIGTVGPYGLLSDLAAGGRTSYRPLHAHHLAPGSLAAPGDRLVRVAADRDAWASLLDGTGHEVSTLPDPGFERRPTRIAAVGGPHGELHVVLCAAVDEMDPRVAHLRSVWFPNLAWVRTAIATDLLGAAFTALFRSLAELGVVGIRASESWFGPDSIEVLRRVGGFEPVASCYAALGLSTADAQWRINAWAATVEDDHVVDFVTRAPVDEPGRRALLGLVRVQLPDVTRGTSEVAAPLEASWRLTLAGELALDGTTGIGFGGSPDWYTAEDRGDGSLTPPRARRALAHWIDDQLASP